MNMLEMMRGVAQIGAWLMVTRMHPALRLTSDYIYGQFLLAHLEPGGSLTHRPRPQGWIDATPAAFEYAMIQQAHAHFWFDE